MNLKPAQIIFAVMAGALIAGGGYALAASRTTTIHGCVNKRTRVLTVAVRCDRAQSPLVWDTRGPAGPRGPRGFRGVRGVAGPAGAAGSVAVGSVSTGAPGSQASVINTGSSSSAILDFTIPQGATGATGATGANGTSTGTTAYGEIWMGKSTAQLAPGPSQNIVGEGSNGVGGGAVDVQGCSTAGLANPVVQVTADKDPNDNLQGANNTANVASAYVTGWSTEPDTNILVVDVATTNPVNGAAVLSDFSISVSC